MICVDLDSSHTKFHNYVSSSMILDSANILCTKARVFMVFKGWHIYIHGNLTPEM